MVFHRNRGFEDNIWLCAPEFTLSLVPDSTQFYVDAITHLKHTFGVTKGQNATKIQVWLHYEHLQWQIIHKPFVEIESSC